MKRVIIVTDSNSGISQDQAKELGVEVIPMPFTINEKEYFEGITLSREEFYRALKEGADISTSQPSTESVTSLWDKLLKQYESIVHIPMSSGLSSSCETAAVLAGQYDGRVQVVNNQRISVTQRHSVLEAKEMVVMGYTAEEIKVHLEEKKYESGIYIMLDTLKYLKKGGRITPAAAALGTILRIKPVLQIQGEKLDAFAKARTVNQAKTIMMNAIKNDLATRFGGEAESLHLAIAHTENEEAAELFKTELLEEFPNHDIYIDHLSLSVSCHIGPGALAFACSKKMFS